MKICRKVLVVVSGAESSEFLHTGGTYIGRVRRIPRRPWWLWRQAISISKLKQSHGGQLAVQAISGTGDVHGGSKHARAVNCDRDRYSKAEEHIGRSQLLIPLHGQSSQAPVLARRSQWRWPAGVLKSMMAHGSPCLAGWTTIDASDCTLCSKIAPRLAAFCNHHTPSGAQDGNVESNDIDPLPVSCDQLFNLVLDVAVSSWSWAKQKDCVDRRTEVVYVAKSVVVAQGRGGSAFG